MCISVPMRYLELVDKVWRKNYFYNPTHTITKLRFLETFSQKNFKNRKFKKKEKEKLLLWLKFQKRRNFWKSKAIDKFTPVNLLLEKYFCNFLLTWRFPYSKKRWFLALKNLNRLSIYKKRHAWTLTRTSHRFPYLIFLRKIEFLNEVTVVKTLE